MSLRYWVRDNIELVLVWCLLLLMAIGALAAIAGCHVHHHFPVDAACVGARGGLYSVE